MFATMNAQVLDFVHEIENFLKKKVPHELSQSLIPFVHQYFANVPVDELVGRNPEDFVASVLSHWALIQKRKMGTPAVSLFNPSKKDGWTSEHSIIEIVHEDLPFLLDTIVMVLNDLEINIHLMIYASIRRVKEKVLLPTDPRVEKEVQESVIWLEIDRQNLAKDSGSARTDDILNSIKNAMHDNELVTNDFLPMKQKVRELIASFDSISGLSKKILNQEDISEAKAFLEWLDEDRFTFLGYGDYLLKQDS
jgi:glutamate dehydrogenase